jgi:site-specific DNA recombinase
MKKGNKGILVPDEDELPGLLMAYELYATGKASDMNVAEMLNKEGYRSKTGRRFSKETVRDILQNQTYLGKTKYQKYKRRSDGSRSYEAPIEWFEGQHGAVIDEDLFAKCQEARAKRRTHRQATPKYNPYLLRNLIYCYRCCSNPPDEPTVPQYGKMRPQARKHGQYRHYRCRARELGYVCKQGGVDVEKIDNQVVQVLMNLKPPDNWRKGLTKAMSDILGERNLEERIQEIKDVIQRMDARWDHGFIASEDEYVQQRIRLQMELEQLTPITDNELEQAADLLSNFGKHWKRLEGNEESRHDLVKLIVERVYVRNVSMILRHSFR